MLGGDVRSKYYLAIFLLLSLVVALLIAPDVARAQGRGGGGAMPATPPQPQLKQVHYIKASNAEAGDYFGDGGANQSHTGSSIALSRDGNTMAIGAPYESSGSKGINGNQNDNSVYASGAVYVFTRNGDNWVQSAYVKASNPGQSDHFGGGVALSTDGNTMAVSAYFEASAATGINGNQNDDSLPQAGAAYVFTRTGGTWSQQAYIKASNTGRAPVAGNPDDWGDGDQFGFSIALNADGNTLAVGAVSEDSRASSINNTQFQNDDSAGTSGAVYVFTRAGSTWSQQAYIKTSSSQAGAIFGYAVALSADGNDLVASSFDERSTNRDINGIPNALGGGVGALFVFRRDGSAWRQVAYVKGSKSESSDQLGYAVAISDDGNTIAAGAGDEDCLTSGINPPGCENDSPPRGQANIWVGAAYVFVRNGGFWTEQAFIKASNAEPYSSFGVKLALSADGNTLAVGAYLEDSGDKGVQGPELRPFLTVPVLDAWRDSENRADESGAVYFYTRTGATWTQRAYVKASNAEKGDEFGSSVALSGDGKTLVVGAHEEDSAAKGFDGNQADNSAPESGAVYVFAY
jgi:hypothetical protein